MISAITRARLFGALILVVAFAAGMAVGRYLPRTEPEGLRVMFKASDRIPVELERLNLTDSQVVAVRRILRRGTGRVDSVMQSFVPAMDAAIGATDSEIRIVLTPAQRTALDAARKERPMKVMKREREVVGDSGR
jgi:hypothetical protein